MGRIKGKQRRRRRSKDTFDWNGAFTWAHLVLCEINHNGNMWVMQLGREIRRQWARKELLNRTLEDVTPSAAPNNDELRRMTMPGPDKTLTHHNIETCEIMYGENPIITRMGEEVRRLWVENRELELKLDRSERLRLRLAHQEFVEGLKQ